MDAFGFTDEEAKNWFNDREQYDNNDTENQDEGYQEFVEKFEEKKTTDDCYTPNRVYDAVADYVADYYGLDKKGFIRPFYPGGDYKKEKYPEGCVVVDNPPFSILSEIQKYYNDNGIKFFLFAPGLTSLQSDKRNCTIACGVPITYENGAMRGTSSSSIFGGAFLLSEKAAAEKAAAHVWTLSDREKDIVRSLGK